MFPLRLCRSKKRLFSFHLQITECFHEVSCFQCGMARFNADTVPWYSDGVQLTEWKSKERVRKWGTESDWGGDRMRWRGALIERLWLAVFSRPPGPVTCSDRAVSSRGAVKEKSATRISPLPSLHSTVSLATQPHFSCPSYKINMAVQSAAWPRGVSASCRG